MIFRAFASYHKATAEMGIDGAVGPFADRGATVGYHVGRPTVAWTSVELFEGTTSLGRSTPADARLAVERTAEAPGHLVRHGVVTFADRTHRTTLPRRVFVRPAVAAIAGAANAPGATTARK